MKIVSLNTWGGRAGKEGLLDFFSRHNHKVDIFCLQEIWSAPYENMDIATLEKYKDVMAYGLGEVTKLLPEYVPYFRPHHLDNYGLLTMVHKDLVVTEEGEVFVHKEKGYIPPDDVGHHARNVQHITIEHNGRQLHVLNFHGLWNGQGKGDSEDRLAQSEKIISFCKNLTGEIVLMGDFNLLPETKSITLLEEFGLKNLIKEFGITSTRTSHYTKSEKFADYAFVSKGLVVKDFKVLPDEVSDHAPLYLEIL
jgi:endonuclease/exonuclease/phosphatase family metal-dependent hydrolase